MYVDSINKNSNNYALGSFGNIIICDDSISTEPKTITFPTGYNLESNLSFKVLFVNGHNCSDDLTHLSLDTNLGEFPVVVNVNGVLTPLPIHTKEITGDTDLYESISPNIVLDLYYESSYSTDGAFVVIGNPLVISELNYAVYADGRTLDDWNTIKSHIQTELGLTVSDYGGNSATCTLAYKVRTTAPSSPSDGDIWLI